MQEQLEEYKSGCDLEEGWVLVCKHAEGGDRLVPVESTERIQRQQQLFGVDYKPVIRYGAVAHILSSLHVTIADMAPRAASEARVQHLAFLASWKGAACRKCQNPPADPDLEKKSRFCCPQ